MLYCVIYVNCSILVGSLNSVVSVLPTVQCLFVYSTQIVLRDAEPVVMTSSQCSCKAGTAVCNHTVALLFQTAHYSELNIQVVPPVHACTETWHKPRTAVKVEANVLYMYVRVRQQ